MNTNILPWIVPFGRNDIERVNNIIDEAGLDMHALAAHINEYLIESGETIADIDIVAMTYGYVLDRTAEWDKAINSNETNLSELVRVDGNSLATGYNYRKEDR